MVSAALRGRGAGVGAPHLLALLYYGFAEQFDALVRKVLRDGLSDLQQCPSPACATLVMAQFVVINESGRAVHLADDRIKSAVCTQLKIGDRISRQNLVKMFSNRLADGKAA